MSRRSEMEKYILAWAPTMIWAMVILMFSVLPYGLHPPLTMGFFDKMAHFFEYTVLAVVVAHGLYRMGRTLSLGKSLIILISGGGYGILMELVQRLVPGRDASLEDVIANVAGTVFGIILGKVVLWQK